MSPRALCLAVAIVVIAAVPARADGAGGGPLYLSAGMAGVTVPGGIFRYITTNVGYGTLLQRVRRDGGAITRFRMLHGYYDVPAVAVDGTAGGLSADGRLLVLSEIPQRFPVRRTHFALVDGATLHLKRIALRGQWGFDAVSPDGTSLYLTQYTDAVHYALRRYDVAHGRVVPGVIVDRREPDERMAGTPLTRVASPDGRWAYTLYDGAGPEGSKPFIHALNTARGHSYCIDLDDLDVSSDLSQVRLVRAWHEVRVVDHGTLLATLDTATNRVVDGIAWWDVAWE